LPEVARRFALPPAITESFGLYRCGFHGLAHAALARLAVERCGTVRTKRVISLQLGSGASVAALRDGKPLDVSMGFSTLEGLVMGSRCGDIDPGVLLHLLEDGGYTPAQLQALLAQNSGLLRLSGRSNRLEELLAVDEPASVFAVDTYVYRARKYVGSYLAVLGGVDVIVFGGGVGEHSPTIRARVLADLGFAGIALDSVANEAATGGTHEIGAPGAVRVFAAAVDEARELASAALEVTTGT
jgi:acetate kinase